MAKSIEEQIELINSELKKDSSLSLKKVLSLYNLKKNKNDFEANGYTYDHESRAYLKQAQLLQKQNKSEIQKDNNEKEIAITKEIKQENNFDMQELQKVLLEVKELLKVKDELLSLLQKQNESKILEDNELKIDRNLFDGDPTNRVIKIYGNVNAAWMKFCNNHKEYKMQDLYSLALLEFIEKYKNK